MDRMPAPEICPVCGESVPPKAKACPSCGADERSGWNEDNLLYDGLDLPDEAWDEPGKEARRGEPGIPALWKIAALILFLALVLLWARR